MEAPADNKQQSSPPPQSTSPRRNWQRFIPLAARWILGAVFIYMGAVKVLHPIDFLKLIREYQTFDNYVVLNAIAGLLPWFEVYCGLLLIGGIAVRATALLTLAMLIPFTVLVFLRAKALAHDQGIWFCAVKFNCGCGGGETLICRKLVENAGLMFLAGVLVANSRTKNATAPTNDSTPR
jgi:uncharacterized membrane protein YphA (DoxX/SURF4 family)